ELIYLFSHAAKVSSCVVSISGRSIARRTLLIDPSKLKDVSELAMYMNLTKIETGKLEKEMIMKLSKQISNKWNIIASKISVVGSIADIIYNGNKAYEEFTTYDTNTAVCYSVAALGAGASTAGGIILILAAKAGVAGAATSPTPLGWVLLIVGGILGIIGSFAAFFADNKPLDNWVQFGYWGNNAYAIDGIFVNPSKGYVKSSKNDEILSKNDKFVCTWRDDQTLEYKWLSLLFNGYDVELMVRKPSHHNSSILIIVNISIPPSYRKSISFVKFKIEFQKNNKWNSISTKKFKTVFYEKSIQYKYKYKFKNNIEISNEKGKKKLKTIENIDYANKFIEAENIRVKTEYFPDKRNILKNINGKFKEEPNMSLKKVVYEKSIKNKVSLNIPAEDKIMSMIT
ncbi:MAG: hypothetical protein GY714_12565, partial [Desulfobacterales bacterium]|nr:hypothetical protein [Desulfobacterales bacterium]